MRIIIKNESDEIYGAELYNEDCIINTIEVDDNYKLFKFKLLLIELEIDNKLFETQYEDNFDFVNFSTILKPIAIYFPNIYLDDFKNLISLSKQDNCEEVIRYYYEGDVIENISYSLDNKRFLESILVFWKYFY